MPKKQVKRTNKSKQKELDNETDDTGSYRGNMYFPKTLEYYFREYYPTYYRIYYMKPMH